jgi:conjugative transfer pilus assembly protein TraH
MHPPLAGPHPRRAGAGQSALRPKAQADVNGQLNSFFSNLGGAANATGPVAYNGQQGGYYSGGNLWVRFPAQTTYQLGSLQMPSVKAGCGGIDIFTGGFSFINTDQIVAAMKAAANGALAFVFDLAINAISSQIGTSIEKMMQKVQQFTQHSLDACQAGQQVAAGLAGMVGARDSQFCKIIGNSQGVFSDWASSEQGCGTGGSQSSTIKGNSDSTIPAGPYNYTWSMLSQKYPSFDTDFKQYLMSLVGTVIYQPGTSDTQGPTFKFLGQGDPALITALLDGGNSASVYACDTTDKCLNPTQTSLSVSTSNALKTRVYNLLIDIAGRIQGNQQLTSEEIGLLGATTIPLYKIMVVNAAASFGGMNSADISSLADHLGRPARDHRWPVLQTGHRRPVLVPERRSADPQAVAGPAPRCDQDARCAGGPQFRAPDPHRADPRTHDPHRGHAAQHHVPPDDRRAPVREVARPASASVRRAA